MEQSEFLKLFASGNSIEKKMEFLHNCEDITNLECDEMVLYLDDLKGMFLKFPNNLSLFVELALHLFKNKYFSESIQLLIETYAACSKEDVVNYEKIINTLGKAYWQITDYQNAIKYHTELEEYYRDNQDKNGRSIALHNLGLSYRRLGELATAIEKYSQAYLIMLELDKKGNAARILNSIAIIHEYTHQYEKSYDYLIQAYKLLENVDNKKILIQTLNNLGDVCEKRGEVDVSIEYFQRALTLNDCEENSSCAISYNNLGYLYQQKEDFPKALEYYEKSLAIKSKINFSVGISFSYNNIGSIYFDMGDKEKAYSYFVKALQIAEDINEKDILLSVYHSLYLYYLSEGKYKKALEYHIKYFDINDEILNMETVEKVAFLEAEYGTKTLQSRFDKQQKLNEELIAVNKKLEYEVALREKIENEYKVIANTANEIMIKHDLSKHITYYNKYSLEITGYSADDLKNMTLDDLIIGENVINWEEKFQARIDGDRGSFHYELDLKKKDGSIIPLEVNSSPIVADGKISEILVIARDISTRKEEERERLWHKRITDAINHILRLSLQIKEEKVLMREVIKECLEITGSKYCIYSKAVDDDFMGMILAEDGEYDEINEYPEELKYSLETDYNINNNLKLNLNVNNKIIECKQKMVIQFLENNSIVCINKDTGFLDEDLKAILMLAKTIEAVISRFRIEKQTKKYQEDLELLNRMMRHDLTNDLASIKSALNLYIYANKKDYLKAAIDKVDGSIKLIKQLRKQGEFMQEHGRLEKFELQKIFDEVIVSFPETEIIIEGNNLIFGDHRIYSVFDNLIKNAIVHGKSDRIVIEIDEQEIFKQVPFVVVKFVDNGSGLPSEVLESIFQQGFTFGDSGQTGEGLFFAKTIIEDYGGNIWAENNKPQGLMMILRFRKVIR